MNTKTIKKDSTLSQENISIKELYSLIKPLFTGHLYINIETPTTAGINQHISYGGEFELDYNKSKNIILFMDDTSTFCITDDTNVNFNNVVNGRPQLQANLKGGAHTDFYFI